MALRLRPVRRVLPVMPGGREGILKAKPVPPNVLRKIKAYPFQSRSADAGKRRCSVRQEPHSKPLLHVSGVVYAQCERITYPTHCQYVLDGVSVDECRFGVCAGVNERSVAISLDRKMGKKSVGLHAQNLGIIT